MIVTQTWRTLAEPTYGIGAMGPERGQAVRIPADTLTLPLAPEELNLPTPEDTVVLEGFLIPDELCPVTHWYVTASALRFEESS